MTSAERTVAIVEDDDQVRSAISSLVRSVGLHVTAFNSAEAFLEAAPEPIQCIISDVQMPGMSGLDLLDTLRVRGDQTPIIIMTAYPTDRARDRAIANGAKCFLQKPCDPEVIVGCLSTVFGPLED